jgi:serpin B
MWTCPKCGEKIEDQFDSCWKCAAQPKRTASSPLLSQRGKRAFLLGILFEIVLILLCYLLPESWLQVEVRNFFLVTHYPLMLGMERFRLGEDAISAILCLVTAFTVMASVWGFLIYLVMRLVKWGLARFATTRGFDLIKELTSLGMPSAFDDRANFSGVDGTTNLYVSDVIHKAFVEVNESGTEAAAVTLNMVTMAGRANSFVVDHPFIFLIRDNGSGTILFLGRIVDPTK